jgi:hypothetical protein
VARLNAGIAYWGGNRIRFVPHCGQAPLCRYNIHTLRFGSNFGFLGAALHFDAGQGLLSLAQFLCLPDVMRKFARASSGFASNGVCACHDLKPITEN